MTYDVNDIIHESEKQKKNPHWLDKLPTKKNKTRGLSADSKVKIDRFLPDKKAEAKKLNELEKVFNTTTRAGAGGTRLGVPGIRPSGGQAASRFLEEFTGTGRFTPEAQPFTQNTKLEATSHNPHAKKPAVVLYKLCQDCMQPVTKDDAVPNLTIIPPPELCAPMVTAKWQSVRLKPGDILAYLFCGQCIRDAQAISQAPEKQIRVIHNGQESTIAKMQLAERANRISDQVFASIKRERDNPDSDCFYGDAKYA
jgi:hypothetical protein